MPSRPCNHVGCPAVVSRPARYCPQHQPQADQRTQEQATTYDRYHRDREAKAFYNSKAWQALRRQVMQEEPICRRCRREFSHDADHVIPRKVDASKELDRANIQGLCVSCHSTKSHEDRKKWQEVT